MKNKAKRDAVRERGALDVLQIWWPTWHVRLTFPDFISLQQTHLPALLTCYILPQEFLFFLSQGGNLCRACVLSSSPLPVLQSSSSHHATTVCHSPQAVLSPCLGQPSETMLFHSLVSCVTHHGNKCVHSFEDCHDRACLSNFPPHIVMPSNDPPHTHHHTCTSTHTAAVSTSVIEDSLEDGTINSIIVLSVAFALSILNATPDRQLQPPEPPSAERMPLNMLTLGDWEEAVSLKRGGFLFLTLIPVAPQSVVFEPLPDGASLWSWL